MKGLAPIVLGIFGTFAFSWAGLVLVPNYQIGHLNPWTDEEGNDPYPIPRSGMAERGRHVYAANGCVYCHSQQIRPDFATADLELVRDPVERKLKWGERRSAPRDYLFDRPVLLGKIRMGPDLANIGKSAPAEPETAPASVAAAPATVTQAGPTGSTPAGATATPAAPSSSVQASPTPASPASITEAAATNPLPKYSAEWHHRHLYNPRSLVRDSNMPAYRFLYQKRRVSGEPSVDALNFGDRKEMPGDWEIVPTYDAKCLVAYLMSLDQSHALPEVKGAAPTSAAPAAAPGEKK